MQSLNLKPLVAILIAALICTMCSLDTQTINLRTSKSSEKNSGDSASNTKTTTDLETNTDTTKVVDPLLWSDPLTWGGNLPKDGDQVIIPTGKHIALDIDSPKLAGLTVHGDFSFVDKDLELKANWIVVHGTFTIGRETKRFVSKATITLGGTDLNESVMGMGTRGILVMGGTLLLFGNPPKLTWTKLSKHLVAGNNELSLVNNPGWSKADKLALAPTSFYKTSSTEFNTIAEINEDNLILASPFKNSRWGTQQYLSPTGLSETPVQLNPSFKGVPFILDERAEVANLSRNIKIQAPDDALWQNLGFGAHVMIMDLSSVVKIDGVEFDRVGQAGILGRYPFHWHMLSYSESTGAYLGDTVGHFIRNSSIHNSMNRCIVVHGTNGTTVQNNICYDIKGHAIFLEDGVERRNIITNNLVLKVRNPEPSKQLLVHDRDSSGYWYTNPDNTFEDNTAADCQGFGIWLSFAADIFGASDKVKMRPTNIAMKSFQGNTSHSNQRDGIMLDNAQIDNQGNTYPITYIPTSNELAVDYSNDIPFRISRITTYKNNGQGIWSRSRNAKLSEFISADNSGKFFAGGGNRGLIEKSLVIGHSLNNADGPELPPVAFATYHSEFDIIGNIIYNFPFVSGNQSGAFATDDYYLYPVDPGQQRNRDNIILNSAIGWREPPRLKENYTFTGALLDPWGLVGAKGNFWVFDDPYLTNGATCTQVAPTGSNGLSCSGPYFGVEQLHSSTEPVKYQFLSPLKVTRFDSQLQEIGNWTVGDGRAARILGSMRHFAVRQYGLYDLSLPSNPAPTWFGFVVTQTNSINDRFILAVPLDQSVTTPKVTAYVQGNPDDAGNTSFRKHFTKLNSLNDLRNSSGNTFYFDSANKKIWLHYQGGLSVDRGGGVVDYNTTIYTR